MDPDPLPPQPWLRSGRGQRRQLSLQLIVDTALDLLAGDGLEAVTMRKVAQRLGTGAASLYAHVRDKAELHELMLDAVLATVEIPDPDPLHWKEQLRELADRLTTVLASRPGIARIALETLIPTTPGMLNLMDRMLGILKAGGLSDDDALLAGDILALYTAAGGYEQGLRSSAGATAEATERIARIGQYLEIVPAGRLPYLVALAPAMSGQRDGYAIGLDLLIDGLAARAVPDPDRADPNRP
ncbi:TetR/AcrR family transcriptional regulator [Microlunatus soli]|uniref:Regulatory protein, tetR family n=1 Tax=Microlunatus soli TaxID=630515 RepID=A0A1H1MEX2_9ACTN|nr:TetR/AcrR family transcriptional regulator [Microlunatus soli]SDR85384.1 regulatory protein, tetR family [Microlunatus soli]